MSVWQNGKELIELHGGFRDARREQPWTEDTIVLIWSATKGIGSACLLHVLQEHKIDIERWVGEVWPEFAQAGKETITLGQLLSHQAGLAALDRKVDLLDYAAVIDALAKQEPNWPPGTAHGYHARTFGFLVDELVRRISGIKLAEYWRKTFAEPLGLDLWIGLPEKENARVATIYAPKGGKQPEPKDRQSGPVAAATRARSVASSNFYADLATKGTFAHKVFASPFGLNAISAMNIWFERDQRDEQTGDPRSADRFVWWNWQCKRAREILRDPGKWRTNGRSRVFFRKNNHLDENGVIRWNRPRVPNSDGIFGRLHERLAPYARKLDCFKQSSFRASHFRKLDGGIWPSRRRWQSCVCGSRKWDQFRLRNESDGAIGFAEPKIVAPGGRDLPTVVAVVSPANLRNAARAAATGCYDPRIVPEMLRRLGGPGCWEKVARRC